jgi:hypothetical protein
MIGLNG